MPRFVLKVLTTDVAERWRQRFCALDTITGNGDRIVIVVGQWEGRMTANYSGGWFHTFFRMCFGSLLDSKVFVVGNTYCNVRANGDNEVTLSVRPGAYVWWLKKGGHLIT